MWRVTGSKDTGCCLDEGPDVNARAALSIWSWAHAEQSDQSNWTSSPGLVSTGTDDASAARNLGQRCSRTQRTIDGSEPSNPFAATIANNDFANSFGLATTSAVGWSAHARFRSPDPSGRLSALATDHQSGPTSRSSPGMTQLVADLFQPHALASHRQHVHILLLGRHEQRSRQ